MKDLSLTSHVFHNDVHGMCRKLRQDDPVAKGKLFGWKTAWYVSRYDDVKGLLQGNHLVKEAKNVEGAGNERGIWLPKTLRDARRNLLFMDEPEHRRLRTLIRQAFTPRRIATLEGMIGGLADRLLGEALEEGSIDFLASIAMPIPTIVIAELVGVPRNEVSLFVGWTNRALRAPTPFTVLDQIQAVKQCLAYIQELADKRRADPQDDLMTALVQAETEGSRLSDDEVRAMVFVLLTAGHETTFGLISNALLCLLRRPDQMALLRKHPEHINTAIEEFLRFESPLLTTEIYYAKSDISLHGVVIPKGDIVLPLLISANRDEEHFDDPDELDVTRSPNRHLAFGFGAHFCIGAALARLEARIAIETLLRRTSKIELLAPVDSLRFGNLLITHHLTSMPVRLHPAVAQP